MKNSKNIRLAATAVLAATGLTATTAAEQIVINGQTIDAGQLIAQNQSNRPDGFDQRIHETVYGGPNTINRIRVVHQPELIALHSGEIASEVLEIPFDEVTLDTPVDCVNRHEDWKYIVFRIVADFLYEEDEEGAEMVITQLSEKENPTLGDIVNIVIARENEEAE